MNDFYNRLTSILQREQSYITDNGEIKKWLVINAAQNYEKRLIELLIDEEELRNKFFIEVNNHLVFNERLFISFMENKNYFNDSYSRFKNKIGLTIDGKYLSQRNEISLVWPFKDCILEGGQSKEEQKKEEIFFNELLAQDEINQLLEPKVLTNWKRYTIDGEQKVSEIKRDDNGLIKENLILKGNNLLALYSLKPQFEGRIKLIYIDPPYNTGNDSFGYNDSFNHSTWLTFMKNRLEIAKQLLKPEGAIFISINHIELGYMLLLMDEIFGSDNKLPIITLRSGTTASYRSINECPVNVTEYVIGYRKTPQYKGNPIYVESDYTEDYSHMITNIEESPEKWELISLDEYFHNKEGCKNWNEFKKKYGIMWKKIRFDMKRKYTLENPQLIVSLNTLQKPSGKVAEIINTSKKNRNKVHPIERENKSSIFCYNGRTLAFFSNKMRKVNGDTLPSEILTNVWDDVSFLGIGPEGGVDLPNGKKPELLIRYLIEIATEKNDIVLDYHIGTGTTCAVAHKMNRQYIGIEQLDYEENDSVYRIKNVIGTKEKKKGEMFDSIEFDKTGISDDVNWQGGGEFLYMELCKYNESFIEKIEKSKDTKSLLKIWEDMKDHSFLNYNIDIKKQDEAIDDFKSLSIKEQKKHLCEILNKNQLYVNISSIEDSDFKISKEDKTLNSDFYGLQK